MTDLRQASAPAPHPRRHVVEYLLLNARRYWRTVVIEGVATPLFYVLALGVGLGVVVDDANHSGLGVPYLVFVAPAFLTAAALQIAATETSFPVMAGFKWLRIYHGIAATSVRPGEIADAILGYLTLRLLANSTLYLAIMACFGAVQRWQSVLIVPIATLCGLAFGAPVLAMSASLTNEGQAFNVLSRFVVTPMFLFAGTFYPIDRLPEWGRSLAYVSPLWHGTELSRTAAIGTGSAAGTAVHVAYLALWLGVGAGLARWRFRVRIES